MPPPLSSIWLDTQAPSGSRPTEGGQDQAAGAVAVADLNGDGVDDLVVGARYADPHGRINAGQAFVVYGGSSTQGTVFLIDTYAGPTLRGAAALDQFGGDRGRRLQRRRLGRPGGRRLMGGRSRSRQLRRSLLVSWHGRWISLDRFGDAICIRDCLGAQAESANRKTRSHWET